MRDGKKWIGVGVCSLKYTDMYARMASLFSFVRVDNLSDFYGDEGVGVLHLLEKF